LSEHIALLCAAALYLLTSFMFFKYYNVSRKVYFLNVIIGLLLLLFFRATRPFLGVYININSISVTLAILLGPSGVLLSFLINLLFL
jgi:hypothetical protein